MSGRKQLSVEENVRILVLREGSNSNGEIERKTNWFLRQAFKSLLKRYTKDGSWGRKEESGRKQVITLQARWSLQPACFRDLQPLLNC